jgi:multidrug efflux pump subunit AcrA (membrane-fusion protein)
MDGPARRRRLRHVIGTACAGALLLALASVVPAHAPGGDEGPTDATVSEATPSPMPTTHEGLGTTPRTHASTATPQLG